MVQERLAHHLERPAERHGRMRRAADRDSAEALALGAFRTGLSALRRCERLQDDERGRHAQRRTIGGAAVAARRCSPVRTGTIFEETPVAAPRVGATRSGKHAAARRASARCSCHARCEITHKSALFVPAPDSSRPGRRRRTRRSSTGTVEADETYVGGQDRRIDVAREQLRTRHISKAFRWSAWCSATATCGSSMMERLTVGSICAKCSQRTQTMTCRLITDEFSCYQPRRQACSRAGTKR